jgi:hypothetical protein
MIAVIFIFNLFAVWSIKCPMFSSKWSAIEIKAFHEIAWPGPQ